MKNATTCSREVEPDSTSRNYGPELKIGNLFLALQTFISLPHIKDKSKSQHVAASGTDMLSSTPQKKQYHYKQCETQWRTHVERRSHTVLNQPTQTASSTQSEITSCSAALGSDSGHPLYAPCLSEYITVSLSLCGLPLTLIIMYGNIKVT